MKLKIGYRYQDVTLDKKDRYYKYILMLILLIIINCAKANLQSVLFMNFTVIPEIEKRTGEVNEYI